MKFKDFEDFQDTIKDEFLECKKKEYSAWTAPCKTQKMGRMSFGVY